MQTYNLHYFSDRAPASWKSLENYPEVWDRQYSHTRFSHFLPLYSHITKNILLLPVFYTSPKKDNLTFATDPIFMLCLSD